METQIIISLFLNFLIIDPVPEQMMHSIKLLLGTLPLSPDAHTKLEINKFAMEMSTFHGKKL